jgi:hypothetical protein
MNRTDSTADLYFLTAILAAILCYANYLKLLNADSEPVKRLFKLVVWTSKIHHKKNLRPQNNVEPSGSRTKMKQIKIEYSKNK